MHILELKEDRHNPEYFNKFAKENEQVLLDLQEIIDQSINTYRDIESIISKGIRDHYDIMLKLQEEGLALKLSPDILELIEQYANLPEDARHTHPLGAVGLNYNTNRYDNKVLYRLYGNIKVGDRSKVELFDDSHIYFIKKDGAKIGAIQVDLSSLIGVGVDLRDSQLFREILGRRSDYSEDAIIGKDKYRLHGKDNTFNNIFIVKAEFNTILIRLMTAKLGTEEYNAFKDAIKFTLIDKYFRNQVVLTTYIRHMYYDRSLVTNNLETLCKLAFLMKLCFNSANGIDTDDLGDSFYKLFRDFDYNLQYRGTFDSIFNTANLWIRKLTQGGYDLDRFTDECLFEYLDLLHKSRQAIMVSHRAGRVQYANRVVTGMQLLGTESISIKDAILNEFNIKAGYETLMKSPANWSSIGLESAGSTYMTTRAKMLNKLNIKERKIFITCESDLMKLRTDAMNTKTVDGQKLIVNKLNALGKIITLELEDKPSENLKDILNMLDNERITILEKVSNRSIWKERNSMLYGQLRTMKDWNF